MKKALIILFFVPVIANAQVAAPPTLLAGLSGLSVDKGNLDVALISEIVSEKQAELKKELIKRLFFDKLNSENYVTWEFAYNSLEILLNSQSKPSIQKELLEYASNATLVYGFTEAYLQISKNLGNSDLDLLIEDWDKNSLMKDCFNYPHIDCSELRDPQLILPELVFKNPVSKEDKEKGNLNNLLLDIVYDVLRKDPTLQNLGFFRTQLTLGEANYQKTSRYWRRRNDVKIDALYQRIKKELGIMIKYYYVAKVAINVDSKSLENLIDLPPLERLKTLDTIKNEFKTIEKDLANLSQKISSSPTKESNLSNKISEAYLAFVDFTKRGDLNYRVEDLFYADQITIPLIVKLTAEYGLPEKYLKYANKQRDLILGKLLETAYTTFKDKIDKTYSNSSVKNIFSIYKIKNYKSFVDLLDKFSKLDEAATYQFILSELKDLSKIFEKSDPTLYVMVSSLSDFLKKFTVFDKDKNAISMDVEEVILQLYKQYETQTKSWFQLYFSVGLNQTFNSSNLTDANGGNVGFASEKLGFKIIPNRWNVKKKRAEEFTRYFGYKAESQGFVNKTPFVSDVHFIAYTSGLLYNVVNIKTEEKFTRPLFGIGIGPSFYNSLDLHFFVNWTFPTADQALVWDKPITGFSFDIKIGEYLTRLKSKRAQQKTSESNK